MLPDPSPYSSLVDFSGLPRRGGLPNFFHDSGSHMGFSLPGPTARDSGFRASFGGPWLLAASDFLLSRALVRVRLVVDGHAVSLSRQAWEARAEPGRLVQCLEGDGLELLSELFFTDSQSAVMRWRVGNRGKVERSVGLEALAGARRPAKEEEVSGGVAWKAGRRDYPERVIVASDKVRFDLSPGGWKARANLFDDVRLGPGEEVEADLLVFHEYSGGRPWSDVVSAALPGLASASPASAPRHAAQARLVEESLPREEDRKLAMKCLAVLESNRKAPAGDLRHEGVYPDSGFFKAFWGWDSWKHSYALARLDPGLAKSGILAMYDFMDEDGFVPDNVFPVRALNNLRDTKPPLAGWALREVTRATGDRDFAAEAYALVSRQHRWWYAFRDHDGDGLCEYGSKDGTMQAAKWESGMDNAARFDGRRCLANPGGGWSCDIASVDLNAYLYMEKTALAEVADFLGRGDEADGWRHSAARLRDAANEAFFDEERQYYYDIELGSGRHARQAGCEGFIPLWAGMADARRAKAVRDALMDPERFGTFVPCPSLSAADPAFMRGSSYWRGRVWLDQAWFAVSGLRSYGFHGEAEELTARILDNCEGLRAFPGTIRENYSPVDGSGMGSGFFSWSAAAVLMLLFEREEAKAKGKP